MSRIVNEPYDCIKGYRGLENIQLVEFWRWAFSDLCDDDIKGIYAEWMVSFLLGIKSKRRVSWADSDIVSAGGVRVEVKSSAYWQSWKFINEFGEYCLNDKYSADFYDDYPPSKIRFSGFYTRSSIDNNRGEPIYHSDIYVFAFQNEKSIEKWNALDLQQWEFYLVPKSFLEGLSIRSISLSKLQANFKSLSAHEFEEQGREMIIKLERMKSK